MRGPFGLFHSCYSSSSFILGLFAPSTLQLSLCAFAQVQNVTLQNTNGQLVYIPSLCTASDGGSGCDGGWYVHVLFVFKGQGAIFELTNVLIGLLSISQDRRTDPSPRLMDPQPSLGTFSRRSSFLFEVRHCRNRERNRNTSECLFIFFWVYTARLGAVCQDFASLERNGQPHRLFLAVREFGKQGVHPFAKLLGVGGFG